MDFVEVAAAVAVAAAEPEEGLNSVNWMMDYCPLEFLKVVVVILQ